MNHIIFEQKSLKKVESHEGLHYMKGLKHILGRGALLFLLAATLLLAVSGGATGKFADVSEPPSKSNETVYTGFVFSDAAGGAANAVSKSYQGKKLIPGGIAFGVKFYTKGVMVIGFDDVQGQSTKHNPAYDAGIRKKDVITRVDGKELTSSAQLTEAVEGAGGRAITLTYIRDGKEYTAQVTPRYSDSEGRYKTGLWVRDSGAGIGTVTYIDPDTLAFGGLGHGICDSETGAIIPMDRGTVLGVTIGGIEKGIAGSPGEVKGYFSRTKCGSLCSNTNCGVFGIFSELPAALPEKAMPIGEKNELREGDAYIWCTLDDSGPHRYSIKISEINRGASGNKCFTVTVTDPKLIAKTGGIIQGMSGSPIIQNGKLVGAVTHVLINDPTTGYGIFIENMLNAAQMPQARAS